MSTDASLRRNVISIAQEMDRLGFAPSKSGNVSARAPHGLLITPSALPYAQTKPADLVLLDLDGKVLTGKRPPSSEWRFHAAIYRARPEVNAVVHTHSPRATALSCARRGLPAFHYMIAIAGGHDIRCAPYATFGTQALSDHAVRALKGRKATLLSNHGVIAVGATLDGALAVAKEVENLSGQYLDLLAAKLKPVILGKTEMERVLVQFATYGRKG
ncbi:class II aldolase/adducin family protein [Methylocella sp. CPCC 101449]|uniref:class II aldolase/adducin family protein n=1 Tax=Methylocella sp. CPCC 101449 TaxID=2987531 RepID=UPI00288F6ABD|nr:class II aldolase/adducin family protein [Methylocella sp. CPCC 101449]MDT2023456.1 class II aldolase/adducin family protein [Methylocella sp. CPCC 101449]